MQAADQPLVSVVIPVKNGDAWLDKTLPAIFQQKIDGGLEVIVIDSGSTDHTIDLLKKYPVRLFSLQPEFFNHGTTRNFGALQAKGKYIAMTVQDAEPADAYWLQHLLDGFDDDRVAGVCGQQIVPHDRDKNPVDWFRPISAPGKQKYFFESKDVFESLSPENKRDYCRWDNVNAMYRRDILLRLPFESVLFAEDILWARDAMMAGFSIVYNTAARVKHYHIEAPAFTFKRSFTGFYHAYKFFGVRPAVPSGSLLSMLRKAKLLLTEKSVGWKDKWHWFLFNIQLQRAVKKAANTFQQAVAAGDEELEKVHNGISGTPVQALRPDKK